MDEHIRAWQCVGCGRIEAPQTCVGICQDRKVEFVYAFEYDDARAQLELVRGQASALLTLVRRLAWTRPREHEWEHPPHSRFGTSAFGHFICSPACLLRCRWCSWTCEYAGYLPAFYLRNPAWHGHEMLFGFTLAVVTGFLFTAVRNWTGQPTPTAALLVAYAAFWVAGRVLVLTPYALAARFVPQLRDRTEPADQGESKEKKPRGPRRRYGNAWSQRFR